MKMHRDQQAGHVSLFLLLLNWVRPMCLILLIVELFPFCLSHGLFICWRWMFKFNC